MESALVIWPTHAVSKPSTAITKPRKACGGEVGPGCGKGGEIFAKMRILFSVGIDITIASTDFACVNEGESSFAGVWRGGNLSDESGWTWLGRGGGAIVKTLLLPWDGIKSGRGSDSRRRA